MSTAAAADQTSDTRTPPRHEAAFDVPGLVEDFAAAGAAFVASCGGNAVLRLQGAAPESPAAQPRSPRFPP